MNRKLVYSAVGVISLGLGINSAQAQTDNCYMVNSSGQTISLGSLCSTAAPVSRPVLESSNSTVFESPESEPEPESNRGYCEALPEESQLECYDNYDRSGNRVGSTIGGSRYGGAGRVIRDGTYTCEYASQ